ncbi:helix-turn-helix transcriptional regulator [Massilia sp. MB5]|uniref:winged helix-turn-helix transcriptional regulator n=1 Tax=unclassified Massilia TaxID=2609279 RepID=UPI00067C5F16|nr:MULTISPECIES: helix-turn-helix domain-containing protein [unclassified Massilia]AKU22697.1 hypothetical protein ACZ75_15730 [Massilia sp. NR 4-1]UMR32496.1 helix-turn-helix transcriptional regulator [Massilia sp. MB5]
MPHRNAFHKDEGKCRATRAVLDRLGDKWSFTIVSCLCQGPLRFNEIRRGIGVISQRMLTLTLRGLERDGLVVRTVYPTVPPGVEYALTELGHSLLKPMVGLVEWAYEHQDQVHTARNRFDEKSKRSSAPAVGITHGRRN